MNCMKQLGLGLLLGVSLNAHAYYTQQGDIFEQEGEKVTINGVSWSGFQDTNVFQGLQNNPFYAITTAHANPRNYGMMDLLSHPWDFAGSGVDKTSAVQFKTVRLPIQPEVLYDESGEVDLNKSFSDKANPTAGNGLFCKTWQSNGQACEKAVSPKQAFWTVLKEMQKHNIKVMIDFHHKAGYGDGMRDGTVYDMGQYSKDLTLLANKIKQEGLDNVIGIDVFNEPYRLNWFQANGQHVAWTKVIATAANAVHSANSDLLLFVEGPNSGNDGADNPTICVAPDDIKDDPDGYSHSSDPALCGTRHRVFFKGNWGEDFKPLLDTTLAKQGVAQFDKDKFKDELSKQGINAQALSWLMGNAHADESHLVFSPHVYPREVGGWETAPGAASNLRFDWTWGFLHKAGYPIVLGEASWKTAQGKAFFTKALMPYLQKDIGSNNVFFWAIGFLGDTVTAIDPQSGELNLDVQATLKPFFGEVAANGTLAVNFQSNMNLSGEVLLDVSSSSSGSKLYNCALDSGCSVQLAPGSYTVSVPPSYHLQAVDKTLYELKSAANQTISIAKNATSTKQIVLQATPHAILSPHHVRVNLNLLDESGQATNVELAEQVNVRLTSQSHDDNQGQCSISQSLCELDIYNDNIDEQGQFEPQTFKFSLPETVRDKVGNTYYLDTESVDDVVITANQEESLTVTPRYLQQSVPVNDGACKVTLAVDNWWQSGAVLQGTVTNSSDTPIKNFNVSVDMSDGSVANLKIVNAWVGNNTHTSANGNRVVLSADTYDSYNGMMPGQSQHIGFQLEGIINGTPKIAAVECQ